MADPLSLPAGAVGIVSLTIQLTQSLHKFYTSYKDREATIAHTTSKLERLLTILNDLHTHVSDREFRTSELDLLRSITSSIEECREYVDELEAENDKVKKRPEQGFRTTARRLAYPFRQSTLQKLDEDIDGIVSLLSTALQLLQQNDVAAVRSDVADARALLELLRTDQISYKIRSWLKAPDPSVEYNKACAKRYGETGHWFVEGEPFKSWLQTPNSFLWLNGFAGCGKSVLCSTTVQYALRHRALNPHIGLAFFFFVFDDQSKQDASGMLRTLILQLSAQQGDNNGFLSRLYDKYRHASPPDWDFAACLRQLVRAYDEVYIIIDALDESPRTGGRAGVLHILDDMRSWEESGLHLLVTSRDEPDIRDVCCIRQSDSQNTCISMGNDSVQNDITSFVSGILRSDHRLQRWEKYHDEIREALASQANGVFRWVECQITALYNCPGSKRQLDKLLSSLPATLDKTYERILSGISPESAEDARRILTLLCCALRPLTTTEVIDAVAVELGDNPRFDPDGRLNTSDDIRRVCPGLIEFYPGPTSEIYPYPEPGTLCVRIAHFSVQEYLESERICQHNASAFSIRRQDAHTEMASVCVTYLLEPGLLSSDNPIVDYPLASYAARQWHIHYHAGHRGAEPVTSQCFHLFQNHQRQFSTWIGICDPLMFEDTTEVGLLYPIYYAAARGLDLVLEKLLRDCSSANTAPSTDKSDSSPLFDDMAKDGVWELISAAGRGYVQVVRVFLDWGVDVNAGNTYHGNALIRASEEGKEEVVRLLLKRGADVNVRAGGMIALHRASAGGHENVVRLLLEHDADVNARGRENGWSHKWTTALMQANPETTSGAKIRQLLLEWGADEALVPEYSAGRRAGQ